MRNKKNKKEKNYLSDNFFLVGLGQDSHKFSKDGNKKLVLGGFIVPNEIGLEADSDGDIILHAMFNAISQAIGDYSLGYYADNLYKKGIEDSKEYLKIILNKLYEKKMRINNVGVMIEAKKPRLEPYNGNIKNALSKILKIGRDRIGITFTSGDELTSFGRGVGMQCFVILSLISN